jgi:hypothetical protein
LFTVPRSTGDVMISKYLGACTATGSISTLKGVAIKWCISVRRRVGRRRRVWNSRDVASSQ